MSKAILSILLAEEPVWWHRPEWHLVAATVLLVLVTGWLVYATGKLVSETKHGTGELLKQQKDLLSMQLILQLSKDYEGYIRRYRKRSGELYLRDKSSTYDANRGGIHDGPRQVLDFLDSLGSLQRRGLLDAETIWEEFGPSILCYFTGLKTTAIDKLRHSEGGDPTRYATLQTLYKTVLAIQAKQRNQPEELATPTEAKLVEFFKREEALELERPDYGPVWQQLSRQSRRSRSCGRQVRRHNQSAMLKPTIRSQEPFQIRPPHVPGRKGRPA
jgi:hypothetical protein